MIEDRPNPDLLLAEVAKQEARQKRGTLKVFFGMAAGVGKTYAMLDEARARAAEGWTSSSGTPSSTSARTRSRSCSAWSCCRTRSSTTAAPR
jgi:hypothetical protein